MGGTAIWLAQEYGVRGVGHLVEFRYGDFMDFPFPDACFDAVFNHETYCYAPDKLAYLRGVLRVLRPGGRWQAVDGFLSDKRLTESDEAIHARMQRGWRTEPLQRWRDVLRTLEAAGFGEIGNEDLDSEVAPATERLCKMWKFFGALITPPSRSWAYQEFMDGVINFDAGLREGVFSYRLIFAAKPG